MPSSIIIIEEGSYAESRRQKEKLLMDSTPQTILSTPIDQKIRSIASPFQGDEKVAEGWMGFLTISNRPRENKVQYFNPNTSGRERY
ncbi:MAG: hypothetical protein F6K17_04930 [Okeania sp. SIO3C4]|nr:hypothetical protein [Okeania sp. SIO3B3]NER02024.1 hypothetical protein [Okeania sp. SIO3C4]